MATREEPRVERFLFNRATGAVRVDYFSAIERARKKLARLDERIGELMSQRSTAENELADLLRKSGEVR